MTYGFDDLRSRFTDLVKNGEPPRGLLGHAYLLFGDAGIGKWRFAHDLAQFLERGSWEGDSAPLFDTMFIERDEERSSIGIEKVRLMKQFLWQTPLSSSFRCVFINDAHLLTPEAQGAMLKIVEEPPSHALIVFVSFDPSTLDAPLRSRLQKVYCPRMSNREIEEILVSHFEISQPQAKKISERSFGRLGRALSLAGKAPGDTRREDDPERIIEDAIVSIYAQGVVSNHRVLAELLVREEAIKRFNVNGPLQIKALNETIHASNT